MAQVLSDTILNPCRHANRLPFRIEAIVAPLTFVLGYAGLALIRFRKKLD